MILLNPGSDGFVTRFREDRNVSYRGVAAGCQQESWELVRLRARLRRDR